MPWFDFARAFNPRKGVGVAKPSQWLPSKSAEYWFAFRDVWLLVTFQPHRGMYPVALYRRVKGAMVKEHEFPSLWSRAMKKLSLGADSSSPLPPLSGESKLFGKLPRFRAFLTDNQYEDGSPRAPGRVWLDQDGVGFTLTLFEPSAMARVRFRAATLDDVYALAETHLGNDSAPWEIDQYARDKAAGKKKK